MFKVSPLSPHRHQPRNQQFPAFATPQSWLSSDIIGNQISTNHINTDHNLITELAGTRHPYSA